MSQPEPKPAADQSLNRYDFAKSIDTQRNAPDQALTSMDFEPTSLEALVRVADLISKIPIAPKIYQGQPNIVLMVLWKGRERGLRVMQSLELIYPFVSEKKGPQVAYAADLLYGLVERSGACEYFILVESTADHATYRTQRRGQPAPVPLTYSLADAKLADLLGKENWIKNPGAMCRAAAKRNLCRAVYGDILAGLYTREEIIEAEAIDVTPELPREQKAIEASAQKVIERVKRGSRRVNAQPPAGPAEERATEAAADRDHTQAEQARGAPAGAHLSPDQIEALLQRAEAVKYGGEGWVRFREWVPQTYKLRLELMSAGKYDELMGELDEWAAAHPAPEEAVGDLEGGK